MKRKVFLRLFVLIIVIIILPAGDWGLWSQSDPPAPGKIIIVVESLAVPQYNEAVSGFKKNLKKESIIVHLEMIECDPEDDNKKQNLIKRIKSQQPSLILTVGTYHTKFVSQHINDIPIVFTMVLDPWGASITSKNIVGASLDIPVRVQWETLKSVLPKLECLGVIYNPSENERIIREAKQIANELGLTLKTYPVKSLCEIPRIEDLSIDALWIVPDNMVCQNAILKRILLSSSRERIPVLGFSRFFARAGALMSVACDYEDIGRQSGQLAARILMNENYSQLKISVPRKIKLYINQVVAHRFGINIPKKILQKAEEIFGQ